MKRVITFEYTANENGCYMEVKEDMEDELEVHALIKIRKGIIAGFSGGEFSYTDENIEYPCSWSYKTAMEQK